MRNAAILGILLAMAGLAFAQPAKGRPKPPPPKQDRVVTTRGEKFGEVKSENYQEVVIEVSKGVVERIPASEVVLVQYKDSIEVFNGAVERILQGDFSGGAVALRNTEDTINEWKKYNADEKNKEKKVLPRDSWFQEHFKFWQGVCFARHSDRNKMANGLRELRAFLEKYPRSRFIRPAVETAFDVMQKNKDTTGAEQFASVKAALPPEIQPLVSLRAAEVALAADEPEKAVATFKSLANAGGEIGGRAAVNTIRALEMMKEKDPTALEEYCRQAMETAADPTAVFLARAALGKLAFEKKDYLGAIRLLAEAWVKYTKKEPEREREEAIYTLARAYEEAAKEAREDDTRYRYLVMARGAYTELAVQFRSGSRKAEAEQKVEELDKIVDELEEKRAKKDSK